MGQAAIEGVASRSAEKANKLAVKLFHIHLLRLERVIGNAPSQLNCSIVDFAKIFACLAGAASNKKRIRCNDRKIILGKTNSHSLTTTHCMTNKAEAANEHRPRRGLWHSTAICLGHSEQNRDPAGVLGVADGI